jgi:hypothetical protein
MSNIRWNNVIFFWKNEGMMQQRQSRLGGMTAVSSHICGVLPRRRRAAHRLEPPSSGIRPFLADGASRLRLGSAAASRPYPEERSWTPNAKSARQRPSKINGRDAAPSGSHFCGGLPRRRRAAHRLEPPLHPTETPRVWRALPWVTNHPLACPVRAIPPGQVALEIAPETFPEAAP